MRHLWLLVGMLGLVVSGPVWAASYLRTNGVIVDPIQIDPSREQPWSPGNPAYSGDHPYSGINLEPYVNLSGTDLTDAVLIYADLRFANLAFPDFSFANLSHADLSFSVISANFSHINLSSANLSNADLSEIVYMGNANLSGARLYSADLTGITWHPAFTPNWTGAKYSLNAVDNSGNPIADTIFPAGMDQAWRDAVGLVAVPEPTTALLLGLGLVGLGVIRGRKIQ